MPSQFSEVAIANLALVHLGHTGQRIERLDEASPSAIACNAAFALTRDTLLESYAWRFAERRAALPELPGTPPPPWQAWYLQPNYMLTVLDVETAFIPQRADDRVPFETESIADGESEKTVILCMASAATCIYTHRVTDPRMFSASFASALAWALAYDIAPALGAGAERQQGAIEGFELALGRAKVHDIKQHNRMPEPAAPWHVARGGGLPLQRWGRRACW